MMQEHLNIHYLLYIYITFCRPEFSSLMFWLCAKC